MKKINALAVSFVAVMAVIGFVSIFLMAFRNPAPAGKKEFCIVVLMIGHASAFLPEGKTEKVDIKSLNDFENLEAYFSKLSSQGWELKSVDTHGYYYFQRDVQ